jgi:hypothetical protein
VPPGCPAGSISVCFRFVETRRRDVSGDDALPTRAVTPSLIRGARVDDAEDHLEEMSRWMLSIKDWRKEGRKDDEGCWIELAWSVGSFGGLGVFCVCAPGNPQGPKGARANHSTHSHSNQARQWNPPVPEYSSDGTGTCRPGTWVRVLKGHQGHPVHSVYTETPS